ncbi:MAG: hypothetical protein ACD_34C00443G0002 [uncultured bacterium]|nr:MAG: hypothetical protein ACD_34C00443G0002 [uncultured bacterium]
MKKRTIMIILAILLLGILFPFAALTQIFSGYAVVFNFVFNSLVSHILMHMALFGSFSWIVMTFYSNRPMKQLILICLGCILGVGVIQESIQMLSVGVFNVGASLFDLGIDLAGGTIPLLINFLLIKPSKKKLV